MRHSIWTSVDPLANFNPFMDDEHYIDGDHNGGVFNHFNHNSYGYCYQNPILYVDPNGKQNVAGAVIGAAFCGVVELGGQLFSGKSIEEVDWADVSIETGKGAMIGFNPALVGVADALASTAKGAVDITIDDKGTKDIFGITGTKKSISEFAFDAVADYGAGKVGDFGAGKLNKMTDKYVKKMMKEEVKTTKKLVNATIKYNKVTKGGTKLTSDTAKKASKNLDKAASVSTFARKNTVRAQTINGAVKGGQAVNEAAQNSVIDKVKSFFGF